MWHFSLVKTEDIQCTLMCRQKYGNRPESGTIGDEGTRYFSSKSKVAQQGCTSAWIWINSAIAKTVRQRWDKYTDYFPHGWLLQV
jgi:hypothetical protein